MLCPRCGKYHEGVDCGAWAPPGWPHQVVPETTCTEKPVCGGLHKLIDDYLADHEKIKVLANENAVLESRILALEDAVMTLNLKLAESKNG